MTKNIKKKEKANNKLNKKEEVKAQSIALEDDAIPSYEEDDNDHEKDENLDVPEVNEEDLLQDEILESEGYTSEDQPRNLKRKADEVESADETPFEIDEAEKELEDLVFGARDVASVVENFEKAKEKMTSAKEAWDEDEDLFRLDAGMDENEEEEDSNNFNDKDEDKPAWVDEDDEQEIVNLTEQNKLKKLRTHEDEQLVDGEAFQSRLREQHKRMNIESSWANQISTDDDIMAPFRHVNGISNRFDNNSRLDPENLPYDRCSDITISTPINGAIKSTEFHPNGEAILLSSTKEPICLYRVDGKENPLLTKITVDDYRLTSVSFFNQGDQIVASSNSTKYYTYDTQTGKRTASHIMHEKYRGGFNLGVIPSPNSNYLAFLSSHNSGAHIVSGKTKMLIGSVNLPVGKPKSLVWLPDERSFYTLSSSSDVFKWDVRMFRCTQRFTDYGAFKASKLSISPNGEYLSIGSETGMVNLYRTHEIDSSKPKPIKEIKNIITPIDHIQFNHDSQIMAMASSEKRDQIKLLHLPTQKIFANWPNVNMPISHATSLAFSPNSGYFAVGNQRGRALLFRLKSYPNA